MTFEGYSNDVAFRVTRRCRISQMVFYWRLSFCRPERCESLVQ
jgi:hypothetical protein